MKLRLLFVTASVLTLTACDSNKGGATHEGHDTTAAATTEKPAAEADATPAKAIAITYPQVDANISAALKESVDHYLHVKNALANDDAAEAGKGAEAMSASLQKVDKSLFTPEQKGAYDGVADGIKEHAGQIAKSSGAIAQQRQHFVTLSEHVYALAKAFGGGRTLYHAHCPMAKNNEGAMWLSEAKEINNPYFGAQMLECGTVEEVIHK
ncbi:MULTISPECIES: DUF3347 domain-containing protein [Chitinophagaceae]|uniref:DUF3347 domain-containing protein n=1 Tax=Chitinophagaceae TaxID=563835 RepID=UPI000DEEEBAE|nr:MULTISPECIES: DUF3347 domain-containing protein [Chitinophagaceae]RPD51141.1 DUF3347 domain-containing protein [Paracnuella aquatica]